MDTLLHACSTSSMFPCNDIEHSGTLQHIRVGFKDRLDSRESSLFKESGSTEIDVGFLELTSQGSYLMSKQFLVNY